MILQVSDQFIDELLNEDVGNEGSVADLISGREQSENAENLEMHSASFMDFIVKDEPLFGDELISLQKDRIRRILII